MKVTKQLEFGLDFKDNEERHHQFRFSFNADGNVYVVIDGTLVKIPGKYELLID